MVSKEYDLVILGGGTGGYVSAIRASQLGMKVAIVEENKLGGTCLHQGCIPSKALLRSAEVFQQSKKAADYGVETGEPTLNFIKVQERKHTIIQDLYQGVQGLMKKGKIDVFHGFGRILGPSIFSPMPGTISIEHGEGQENTMLIPKNVLIATGSKPKQLAGLEVDGTFIMTSDEALEMKELPASIIIVGAGAIGVEWASMLADFGVKVTVIEYIGQILPSEDIAIAKELRRELTKKGVQFYTNTKVIPDSVMIDKGLRISAEVDGEKKEFQADKMLISVGREANSKNIGLENTDVLVKNGIIQTNEWYQTKESHIYAIGDVIGGMQLAHVASHEGITAVEHMAGKETVPLVYSNIPSCVYSSPEVASVGLTEKEAEQNGFSVKIGKFPFQAIGKALVYGESKGFVKIIVDDQTEDLLGIHMIGPHVTELVGEAGLAKVLDATAWEIAQTIHPHPSLTEVMGEAALAVEKLQIHS